jgi:hypothetical protein
MNYSAVLKLIALAEAGFDLYEQVQKVRAMEEAGATFAEVTKYIDELYEESFAELNATP